MNSNWYKIILKIRKTKYGKNLLLKGVPLIFNQKGATLILGNNVTIKSSFFSNLVGLYQRSIIVTRIGKAKIIIGNNVGMSGVTIYARKEILIGDNTLIGANTKILNNDFHPLNAESRKNNIDDEIKAKPIRIGNDCFIGCNSIILKGTILGNECIVGAGSVVSGTFPDRSVIVGNPGKIIRNV